MKDFRTLFQFYINSSLHVAFAVTTLAVITALHFNIPLNINFLLFILFGTVTSYNLIKYAEIAKLHHRSLANNLRVIQIFSFFSFLALVYFAFRVKTEVLFLTAFFAFLTALYALPVFSGKRNLRTIKGIKVHVISLVWAGVSVLCPLIDAEVDLGYNVALEFIQRYLFVLVLLLPFEIRDLKYDIEHLGTIPQRIGVGITKILGLILLIVVLIMEFLKQTATSVSITAILLVCIFTSWFIVQSKEEQTRYYSSFLVEGIPMIWLTVLFFLEVIF